MLRWLFNRYRDKFVDFFIEELIGPIPKEVSDDSIKFLANGKERMEMWLRWQSFVIQRKAASNPKDSEVYRGVLIHIKLLLMILDRVHSSPREGVGSARKVEEAVEDLSAVDKFKEAVKTYGIQRTEARRGKPKNEANENINAPRTKAKKGEKDAPISQNGADASGLSGQD